MKNAFIPRTYSPMSDSAYRARRTYYKNKGFQEAENFENYTFNAIKRAIEHSDPSHLSDVVQASRDLGKYRMIYRVLHSMDMPWAWDDIENPKGDVPKANKNKLGYLRLHWDMVFCQAMDKEEVHQQSTPTWDWNKKKAILLRLVADAKKHGVSFSEIEETVKESIAKVA